MVTLWRITKTRYARRAFDGEGARLYGARWSSVGVRVAYASESIALASLEVVVGVRNSALLSSYSLISARVADADVEVFPKSDLPDDWQSHPPAAASQAIGDRWVAEQRSLVLRLPSAIIEAESNFLLNPAHPRFGSVRVSAPTAFAFDPRLLAALRKS